MASSEAKKLSEGKLREQQEHEDFLISLDHLRTCNKYKVTSTNELRWKILFKQLFGIIQLLSDTKENRAIIGQYQSDLRALERYENEREKPIKSPLR